MFNPSAAASVASSAPHTNSFIPVPSSSAADLPRVRPIATTAAFVDHLLSLSVIQLCRAAGFNSAPSSAINILTDVLFAYIQHVGNAARRYAQLSNRQQAHYFDIKAALADYKQSIQELHQYLSQSDPLPFSAAHLPAFPIHKPIYLIPDRVEHKELTDGAAEPPSRRHIPDFLPPFPPARTYRHTLTIPEPQTDAHTNRKRKLEQSRATEESLTNLHAERIKIQEREKEKRQREGLDTEKGGEAQLFGLIKQEPIYANEQGPVFTADSAAAQQSGSASSAPLSAPPLTRSSSSVRDRRIAHNPFLQPPVPVAESKAPLQTITTVGSDTAATPSPSVRPAMHVPSASSGDIEI